MTQVALFIRLKALPGKRDAVRAAWDKHLRPNIGRNPRHQAYFYCYDDEDADVIRVFQLYSDRAGPQEFVEQPWYPAYEAEVTPLLADFEIRTVTPAWVRQ
jgi:quinol monooxygenase YgiN